MPSPLARQVAVTDNSACLLEPAGELLSEFSQFRRDHSHAIPLVRVTFKEALVIVLSGVVLGQRRKLGNDRRIENTFSLQRLDQTLRDLTLALIHVEDH